MSRTEGRKSFAKKSLGQNFLSDPNYIRKIVSALGDVSGEQVLEIGPGRGALTEVLIDSGAKVLAIELDRELVPLLRSQFDASGRFTVVEADALETDFSELSGGRPTKLAANLPYYISTAILKRLSIQKRAFSKLVLMLQKEVVERITAGPGSKDRGYLSVMVQEHFEAEKLFDVPPNAFKPAPKVWSSVVRLIPKTTNESDRPELFEDVVSAGFAQRRKTILNNLRASDAFKDESRIAKALAEAAIDPSRRAETLTLEEWHALARALA